jgi:hypothetical protein
MACGGRGETADSLVQLLASDWAEMFAGFRTNEMSGFWANQLTCFRTDFFAGFLTSLAFAAAAAGAAILRIGAANQG